MWVTERGITHKEKERTALHKTELHCKGRVWNSSNSMRENTQNGDMTHFCLGGAMDANTNSSVIK